MKKQVLYIFMRNDLPSLNAGKAMAQASHASSQFIKEFVSSNNKDDNQYFQNWINEGEGFGTTVVLEGSKKDIGSLLFKYTDDWWQGHIIDNTYPFKAQKELLDLMDFTTKQKYDIKVCDNATMDNYGMINCTRNEHTCSWLFLVGEDETFDMFKKDCEQYNIKLHR